MSTTRGPVFVESVNVDAAWEVYYQLADRRHKDGLTFEELHQVIDAALVEKVEARKEIDFEAWQASTDRPEPRMVGVHGYRFVSPWVEVEEHQ